jgi:hypothetical protein
MCSAKCRTGKWWSRSNATCIDTGQVKCFHACSIGDDDVLAGGPEGGDVAVLGAGFNDDQALPVAGELFGDAQADVAGARWLPVRGPVSQQTAAASANTGAATLDMLRMVTPGIVSLR